MIPSPSWYPQAMQLIAAWWTNFAVQFGSLHLSLGFTAADNTVVQDDNDVVQFVAETAVALEAFADAVRLYKKRVLQGDIGDPMPNIPAYTSPGSPTEVPAGINERLDNLVKRIRVSPTYTAEAGALLGIIPVSPDRPAPETLKPEIKAAALPGSVVSVKFVRGSMSGVVIETQVDNSGAWTNAGSFAVSPAEFVVPQNPENLPRSVQVRARYLDKFEPVGLLSQVDTVSTLPAA